MDDVIPKMDDVIKLYIPLDADIIRFKALLKDNNAIIAGGAVLSAAIGYASSDIDIYVPINNIKRFNEGILEIFKPTMYSRTFATFYCRSFLRRNGIRMIYTFKKQAPVRWGEDAIDVMAVRKNRSPIDVAKNFDLTCCQIWYDGEKVFATHPEHIRTKKGVLQGDYVSLYLNRNMFLRDRVKKYQSYPRIFEITLDPEQLKTYTMDTYIDRRDNVCPDHKYTDVYYHRWATRRIMKYILNKFYEFNMDVYSHNNKKEKKRHSIIDITVANPYVPAKEDGYDSEEYDTPTLDKLEELALTNYGANHDGATRLAHAKHNLYYEMNETLIDQELIGVADARYSKPEDHLDWYKNFVQRIGMCSIELEEGEVWDLHDHTLDEGVSSKGMEGYLSGHIKDVEKEEVVCYIPECTKKLIKKEMKAIVSSAFWERFIIPGNIAQEVETGTFEVLLKNEPTWAPIERTFGRNRSTRKMIRDGWGKLYHHVFCPFCLQNEYRRSGCAYMVHGEVVANNDESPFCTQYLIIPDLRKKYFDAWKRENPAGNYLEFCVTCGRPCCGHKHFDLNDPPGIIEYVRTPGDNSPGQGRYTKCMGGGRPELIARILAIKHVLTTQVFPNDFEQRKACAWAADAAPKDAALMAHATDIFNKPRRVRGTYNTFNALAIQPENDVVSTLEQIEDIVDLEPAEVQPFEIDLARREHEQDLRALENRNAVNGGRRQIRKTYKNKTRS